MKGVSPQPRGTIQPHDKTRIQRAAGRKALAEIELKSAVLFAAEHGASVRELAAFTGLSTNTISRWKRGE